MFSSKPGLYSPDASSILSPIVRIKSFFRYCQIFPQGRKGSTRPQSLENCCSICRVHCPKPLRLVPLPSGIYKGTSQNSWKMEEKDKLIFVQKVFEIHAWFFHNTHFPWTLWRPLIYSSQCPFVSSLKPNTLKPSSFSQLPSGYQHKAAETASYLQAIFSLPITGEPSQVSAGPV